MKLLVDTSGKSFTVTMAAVEKTDQNGQQKTDRLSQEPLWVVQVMALDETGGEMLKVTLAGQMPKVTVGAVVSLAELEAIPWATNGRNGVAYRAKSITVAGSAKAA
ncbi:MAG: hypothetical protein ACRDQ2_05740 [Gaiellales bacterium]